MGNECSIRARGNAVVVVLESASIHSQLWLAHRVSVQIELLCKSPGHLWGNMQVRGQDDLINCLVSQRNGLHRSIPQLDDVTVVGPSIIHVR